MKAIKFKESDYYSIELNRGLYIIDGNPVNVEKHTDKVQVKDINNVVPVTRNSVVDHYWSEGDMRMSISCFEKEKERLLSKRTGYEDYKNIWANLEDEFAYRKFINTWIPIKKDIELKGDPYTFEVVESQIETGNVFIKSDYINGGSDPLLYTYDRYSAVLNIVANKFMLLGMVFKGDIDYAESNNQKVWGNSTHSCIRYVKAFNTYVFNDTWDIKYPQRGTLTKLLAQYNNDKETLENIIQTKYNVHFCKIDSGNFNFEELLKLLNLCKNSLNSIEAKQKSLSDLRFSKNKLNESIKFIENSYKELQDEK